MLNLRIRVTVIVRFCMLNLRIRFQNIKQLKTSDITSGQKCTVSLRIVPPVGRILLNRCFQSKKAML
jgi:hypothetical protein